MTRLLLICCLFFMNLSFAASIRMDAEKLVHHTYLGEFTSEKAKLALQRIPGLENLQPKYSLNLYKIHYKTTAPDGKTTFATGLVAMPVSPARSVSIVAYFHGTRALRTDVPSRNDEKNYIYTSTFGNTGGYMLVMPDYLGLGDNTLPIHPYVDAKTLAGSSIDMILASKELAAILHYPVNDKLFLAGYSEGGATTMVTYEELLKNKELPVTAAAPGSAPYDWDETMPFVTDNPGPRSTVYMAFFFLSLQTYNNYWSGLDEIFRKPYNNLIPVLFDGYHQTPEILAALPANPYAIFQEGFLESVVNGTEKHVEEMKKNINHYDFKSTSPLLLVGTKGDHDVPYHGAEIAYAKLKSQSDLVYIKSVSDKLDHLQAFPFVMNEQLEFFNQYN